MIFSLLSDLYCSHPRLLSIKVNCSLAFAPFKEDTLKSTLKMNVLMKIELFFLVLKVLPFYGRWDLCMSIHEIGIDLHLSNSISIENTAKIMWVLWALLLLSLKSPNSHFAQQDSPRINWMFSISKCVCVLHNRIIWIWSLDHFTIQLSSDAITCEITAKSKMHHTDCFFPKKVAMQFSEIIVSFLPSFINRFFFVLRHSQKQRWLTR